MSNFVKKNLIFGLYIMIISAVFLSVLFNELKCPLPDVCYFQSRFWGYNLGLGKDFLILSKALVAIFSVLTLWIVSRELKDGGFIPYYTAMMFFASVLTITAVKADVEALSLLLLFMVLFCGRNYLKAPAFSNAFLVTFLLSLSIIADIRNITFLITVLVVLFLVDDVLSVISLKKMFSLKPFAGFVLGMFPLIVCCCYDITAEWRELTDDFSVSFSGYLFGAVLFDPWIKFSGPDILTRFIPLFFIASGIYALVKTEFRNVMNHEKEAELSSIDEIIYYIALYFPVIYLIVMSAFVKQKVPDTFFYPLIFPVPFLIKKGVGLALPFFDSEEEKRFIKITVSVLGILFFVVSVFSGTMSLHNVTDARVTAYIKDFIDKHPGKYMTDRFSDVLNYVIKNSSFSYNGNSVSNIKPQEMLSGYDYYIPSKATFDGECYATVEPSSVSRIFIYSYLKLWICSEPVFNYKDKLYVFDAKNMKLK